MRFTVKRITAFSLSKSAKMIRAVYRGEQF